MVSFALSDTKMQIDEQGFVREIEVRNKERDLTAMEMEAVNSPGQEFLINGKVRFLNRVSFFYQVPVIEYSEVIVYKKEIHKVQTIPKTTTVEGEKTLAIYIVFILIGFGLMICSNLAMLRNKDILAFALGVAVVLVLALGVLFSVAVVPTVTATVAIVVAIAAERKNTITYTVFSILFYIAIAIALFA